jgi:hypothetical protein
MQPVPVTVQRTTPDSTRRNLVESPEDVVARALLILEQETRSWMESFHRSAPSVSSGERHSEILP